MNRKRVTISEIDLEFDDEYPNFSFCVGNLGKTAVTLTDVRLYNEQGEELHHNGYEPSFPSLFEPLEKPEIITPMNYARLGYFFHENPVKVTVVLTFKEKVKWLRKEVTFSNLP